MSMFLVVLQENLTVLGIQGIFPCVYRQRQDFHYPAALASTVKRMWRRSQVRACLIQIS
jgi:hypothetical protein